MDVIFTNIESEETNPIELKTDARLEVSKQAAHKACSISLVARQIAFCYTLHRDTAQWVNFVCPINHSIEILLNAFQKLLKRLV
jgi:hypothetical protein